MSADRSRVRVALALQLAALLALSLALLGTSWLDAGSKPRLLVLVDRSQSVPRAASDKAMTDVVRASKAVGVGDLQFLEFAGRPGMPSMRPAGGDADLETSATNIEAGLDAALAVNARTPFAGVVVVSDGLANVGDTARGLRAAREAGLPVQWIAVGRAPPPTHVAQVLAPAGARVGQRLQIGVQLAGQLGRPLRVEASARAVDGQMQSARAAPDGAGRATIEFDAARPGAIAIDVVLKDPATGATLDSFADAAVIDVSPRASILYVQGDAGSPGPLAGSLVRGGWSLDIVPASRLDAQAEGLDGYQAVVLDDVAITDAGPRFWRALVAAVHDDGRGLLVLGGERSFARGGYRASTLESVLPVSSEPAALSQPASVVFAVDKSGSMGQGSGGVDRFRLAQRAVLETARGLGPRDSLGLLVFDVAPRVLIPLAPAPAGVEALARDWQASPNGGTKLAPAIEAAIEQLERSDAPRRLLVLVTDGFVEGAPFAQLRARLDRDRIETIALAVGPDADVEALERLFGPQAGLVLRVDEAAELPRVMRSGLERRRSRVERGTIAAEQRQLMPFPPGTLEDWPAVAAHAVTRPQPQAVVAVQSRRGDPLIAFQRSGLGRVVAVTCGLGGWTPQWLQWREWPRLAGGLAEWIGGTNPGGTVAMAVSDLPAGLQVDADVRTATGRSDPGAVSIAVNTPTMQRLVLPAEAVAPGRVQATLPDAGPGLYTVLASTPLGIRRQLHLRRRRAESAAWGTNPELQTWAAAGLIGTWDARALVQRRERDFASGPVDRSLIGLALALFLCGVLVDRTGLTGAGLKQVLQGRRARA